MRKAIICDLILEVKKYRRVDGAAPPPANRIRVDVRLDVDLKVGNERKAILPPEAHAGGYPAVAHGHAVLGEIGDTKVHGEVAVIHTLLDLFNDVSGIVTEDVGIALGDRREGYGVSARLGGHELIWVLTLITQPFFLCKAAGRGNDLVAGFTHSKHLPEPDLE